MKLDAINAARPRFFTSVTTNDDRVNGVWARPATMRRKSTPRKTTTTVWSHGLLKAATASAVFLATVRAPSLAHAHVLLPGGGPPVVASVAALLLLQWPASAGATTAKVSAEEGHVRRRDLSVLVNGEYCFHSDEGDLQDQCDDDTSKTCCDDPLPIQVRACGQGASGIVCEDACVGYWSCESFTGTAKKGSCHGFMACSRKEGKVGENACFGTSACQDHRADVAYNSCLGEKACFSDVDNNACLLGEEACRSNGVGTFKVNGRSCKGEMSCYQRPAQAGDIKTNACTSPYSCAKSTAKVLGQACQGICSCYRNKSTEIGSKTCNDPCECADFTKASANEPGDDYCKAQCPTQWNRDQGVLTTSTQEPLTTTPKPLTTTPKPLTTTPLTTTPGPFVEPGTDEPEPGPFPEPNNNGEPEP